MLFFDIILHVFYGMSLDYALPVLTKSQQIWQAVVRSGADITRSLQSSLHGSCAHAVHNVINVVIGRKDGLQAFQLAYKRRQKPVIDAILHRVRRLAVRIGTTD